MTIPGGMRGDGRRLAIRAAVSLLALFLVTPSGGADSLQDLATLRTLAAAHLLNACGSAHAGLECQARVGPLDPRLRLPHCPKPEFHLANGSRPHGNGNLRAHCREPSPWTLYLTYGITLTGEVLVARRPLPAGTGLLAEDVEIRRITLGQAPGDYFRGMEQLRGAITARPVASGQAITLDLLKRRQLVRPNQRVRLLAEGAGFQVSQEGIAQNAAYMGETVRVKMPSGRIIQGVAEADGSVRVP
jgi:flagella basal body P-ring formation protein FlgA